MPPHHNTCYDVLFIAYDVLMSLCLSLPTSQIPQLSEWVSLALCAEYTQSVEIIGITALELAFISQIVLACGTAILDGIMKYFAVGLLNC